MLPEKKLFWGCITNLTILIIVITLVIIFRDDRSKYFRFGPQDDLIVISIYINDWLRYMIFCIIIIPLKVMGVVVNEICNPIISWNIYNPDKTLVTEFSKNTLQFYVNSMYMINNLRDVILMVISITQVDLALIIYMTTEITGIFTIRMLLNRKLFEDDNRNFTLMGDSFREIDTIFIPDMESDIEVGHL